MIYGLIYKKDLAGGGWDLFSTITYLLTYLLVMLICLDALRSNKAFKQLKEANTTAPFNQLVIVIEISPGDGYDQFNCFLRSADLIEASFTNSRAIIRNLNSQLFRSIARTNIQAKVRFTKDRKPFELKIENELFDLVNPKAVDNRWDT